MGLGAEEVRRDPGRRCWPRRRRSARCVRSALGAVGEVGAARLVVRLTGRAGRGTPGRRSRRTGPRSGAARSDDDASGELVGAPAPRARARGRGRSRRSCRPAGPARRMRSSARMRVGAPPLTRGGSRPSALSVAGPQVPSGGRPRLRWNSAAPLGLRPKQAVDAARVLKPRSSSRRWRANTSSPAIRLPGRCIEHAVAERPARLVQPAVGGGPTTPSTVRPRCCWKLRTRQLDALVVRRAGRRVGGRAGRSARGAPDLGNRGAGVAASEHGAGCLGVHPGRSCRWRGSGAGRNVHLPRCRTPDQAGHHTRRAAVRPERRSIGGPSREPPREPEVRR